MNQDYVDYRGYPYEGNNIIIFIPTEPTEGTRVRNEGSERGFGTRVRNEGSERGFGWVRLGWVDYSVFATLCLGMLFDNRLVSWSI
jgi:hypothetical protein